MKPIHKNIIRLSGTMLLTLSAALTAKADYQSTVLSQNPSGYWRLNETTVPPALNTTATNIGSVSGNGTYVGPQGFLRGYPGVLTNDTCANFDGTSQVVTNAFDAALSPSVFSSEAWLYASVNSANCAFSDGTFGSTRSGWLVYQTSDTGYELRIYRGTGTAVAANPVGNVTTLPNPTNTIVGKWTHVVATFDGTTAKIYLNGQLSASAPLSAAFVPGVSGSPFSIAERSDGGFLWSGKADEVAYYNTVLTPATIAQHYAAATTNPTGYATLIQASSPLLYYRLDEPGDPFAANSSALGASLTGDYASGTTPGLAGPRPTAYPGFESNNYSVGFNADGASVTVPALNFNTNTVTISGWIKANGPQLDYSGIIMCDAGKTYAGLNFDGNFGGASGGLGIGYTWNNDPNTYNWSPTIDAGLPTLQDSQWAYVALVVQPTEADIYIANTNDPASFVSVTNYLTHVNQNFDGATLFGSDAGVAASSFNGNIDEVAMWNRSLGAGELYSQYATAVGGLGPKIFADLQSPVDPIYIGDTLTLAVDIGGTPNMHYQWYKTSGLIPNATNSIFTKPNIQLSDSDTYYLVATNLFGTLTSASAAITVNTPFPPAIVTPPSGHILYPGGTLNVSVTASGGGLKYQWEKNGVPIAGATASSYIVLIVTTNDTGNYSVTVTNNVGTIMAGPATITVLSPAPGYEAAIVADAPEAWYRLDETSGTVMNDAMGRHDGVYTNVSGTPVTFGATGALVGNSDSAVTFSGPTSVSYGMVPYSPALNAAQYAIEAWVKTTDLSDELAAVSSRSDNYQGSGIWTVPAGNWAGEVSIAANAANYYIPSATPAGTIVSGKWTHVVITYDTSLKVYVNGQWDGVSYVDGDRNVIAPFVIGGFGPPSGISALFNGQIDEVAVYSHGLTLAQAQNHYSLGQFPNPIPPFFATLPASFEVASNAAATVTISGLADGPIPITYQWYKNGLSIIGETNSSLILSDTYSNGGSYILRASNLNGFTNAPAATLSILPATPSYVNVTNGLVLHLTFDGGYQDSSGRGNNGTPTGISNGLPTIVTGRIGSGAVHYITDTSTGIPFNSDTNAVVIDSGYVTLGNPTDLLFGSSVDFSVAYWVKLPVGYVNGDLPFLCSSVQSYGNPGFTFCPGYTNGGWAFSYNGVTQLTGPANAINDGNWHHLIYSVSRTGSAYTYLDGVQVDSRLASGIGNMDTAGPINIGQDPTGMYAEQGSADVDDLAVWRRALTAYEAYSIYYAATNSNSSFNIPGTVSLNISQTGTNVILNWNPGATLGSLQQADNVTGPWTNVSVYAPIYQVPTSASKMFYRIGFSE